MGAYRLLLAVLVALSHMKVLLFGLNPGVVAVISFFLISGYVMTLLIEKYYKEPFNVSAFYLDRAARLFPQYLFYCLLMTACFSFTSPASLDIGDITPVSWLLNLVILPVGFYMFWGEKAVLLQQTWSLGLEMTFYIVIPWIVRYATPRLLITLMALSMGVFAAGYADLIKFDWYAYRLLPGTLFIFLTGSLLFGKNRRLLPVIIFVFAFSGMLFAGTFMAPHIAKILYVREVLVGLLAGIPIVAFIRELKFSALDEFLGNLSYGVFLNHTLLIRVTGVYMAFHDKTFLPEQREGFLWFCREGLLMPVTLTLLGCCLLSYISYRLVEAPFIRWRRQLRASQAKAKSS